MSGSDSDAPPHPVSGPRPTPPAKPTRPTSTSKAHAQHSTEIAHDHAHAHDGATESPRSLTPSARPTPAIRPRPASRPTPAVKVKPEVAHDSGDKTIKEDDKSAFGSHGGAPATVLSGESSPVANRRPTVTMSQDAREVRARIEAEANALNTADMAEGHEESADSGEKDDKAEAEQDTGMEPEQKQEHVGTQDSTTVDSEMKDADKHTRGEDDKRNTEAKPVDDEDHSGSDKNDDKIEKVQADTEEVESSSPTPQNSGENTTESKPTVNISGDDDDDSNITSKSSVHGRAVKSPEVRPHSMAVFGKSPALHAEDSENSEPVQSLDSIKAAFESSTKPDDDKPHPHVPPKPGRRFMMPGGAPQFNPFAGGGMPSRPTKPKSRATEDDSQTAPIIAHSGPQFNPFAAAGAFAKLKKKTASAGDVGETTKDESPVSSRKVGSKIAALQAKMSASMKEAAEKQEAKEEAERKEKEEAEAAGNLAPTSKITTTRKPGRAGGARRPGRAPTRANPVYMADGSVQRINYTATSTAKEVVAMVTDRVDATGGTDAEDYELFEVTQASEGDDDTHRVLADDEVLATVKESWASPESSRFVWAKKGENFTVSWPESAAKATEAEKPEESNTAEVQEAAQSTETSEKKVEASAQDESAAVTQTEEHRPGQDTNEKLEHKPSDEVSDKADTLIDGNDRQAGDSVENKEQAGESDETNAHASGSDEDKDRPASP